jgi:hypothetical protein
LPRAPGFKLAEIKELIADVDSADGMAQRMQSLSSRKLDEIEALLERTKAVKGWLEVAKECGCATPDEFAHFAATGEQPSPGEVDLRVLYVGGKDCRRSPAG